MSASCCSVAGAEFSLPWYSLMRASSPDNRSLTACDLKLIGLELALQLQHWRGLCFICLLRTGFGCGQQFLLLLLHLGDLRLYLLHVGIGVRIVRAEICQLNLKTVQLLIQRGDPRRRPVYGPTGCVNDSCTARSTSGNRPAVAWRCSMSPARSATAPEDPKGFEDCSPAGLAMLPHARPRTALTFASWAASTTLRIV